MLHSFFIVCIVVLRITNKPFGASQMNINIIMSIVFILMAFIGTVYLIKGDNQ